jgi:hypothetical protein
MDKPTPSGPPSDEPGAAGPRPRFAAPVFWLLVILTLTLGFLYWGRQNGQRDRVSYSFFYKQL